MLFRDPSDNKSRKWLPNVNLSLVVIVLRTNRGTEVTDERLLIERAQQGEMEAFRLLVERSKINVYRLAYDLTGNRHDAEDLSQDVFVKAFRSLRHFRGDAKWSTWLYRITVNAAMDRKKAKAQKHLMFRDPSAAEEDGQELSPSDPEPSPDRLTDAGIIRGNIDRALEELSPKERSVFVLRHYHDLSLRQIAESMSISEGTVKSFLFRAIRRLRKSLECYRQDFGLENE